MVAQCANPKCTAEFHSLKRGRLFVGEAQGARFGRSQHYWLCEECCRSMTIIIDRHGMRVVSLHHGRRESVHRQKAS